MNDLMLVGTENGTIKQYKSNYIDYEDVIISHYEGEVQGLCMINEAGSFKFVTAGDDNAIMLYDILERKVIGRGRISILNTFEGM